MTAGAIVQIVLIFCPSKINRLFCLFWTILIIVQNTVVMIISIIIIAWPLTFRRRNYFFLILAHLYIKCE